MKLCTPPPLHHTSIMFSQNKIRKYFSLLKYDLETKNSMFITNSFCSESRFLSKQFEWKSAQNVSHVCKRLFEHFILEVVKLFYS